jgi:hypothetical protein
MLRSHGIVVATVLPLLAIALLACGNTNPNTYRALISVSVSPEIADAQNYPNGQVVFTATGTFNVSPLTGPVPSTVPYNGQFGVANPVKPVPITIATIVATGPSSATVECAAGATGTVSVFDSALANNGTSTTVSGQGQLTCP